MKTHLECRDEDGEWRAACGSESQRTTAYAIHVTCYRCIATTVYKQYVSPSTQSESTTPEEK